MRPVVAILGCGNMGGAIASAIASAEPSPASELLVCDPDEGKRSGIAGAEPVADVVSAVQRADVVLLAVKPQAMKDALVPLVSVSAGKLFISVAAGITTATLEQSLPDARVVRTMPNTPLLVGRGVVAVCGGRSSLAGDVDIASGMFPDALVERLVEDQMDAATAVSGSGPAYFFAFVEALAAAGEAAGLSVSAAARMAEGTLIGAARLLESSDASPAELRRRVTSPGGTTAAALDAFEDAGLANVVEKAVAAAAARGAQLSKT